MDDHEITERQLRFYGEALLRELRQHERKMEAHLIELEKLKCRASDYVAELRRRKALRPQNADLDHQVSGTYQQSPKQP